MSEYGHVGRYTLRCEITRNPCGTDTVAKDSEPDCGPCAAAERIDELGRAIAAHNIEHHKCDCIAAVKGGEHLDVCASKGRIDIAQQPPVSDEHCEWKLDNEYSLWNTECGEGWTFPEGGPRENGVKYCVACGRPVALQEGVE